MWRISFWVCFALPLTAEAQQIVEQAQRPPPLQPQPGCEIWRGENLEGNDDTIVWEIRLCPQGDRVVGLFQTSSLVTGWSSRQSEGRWDGDVLRARDLRFVDNRPLPGWRFCLADRWELRRTGPETMLGEYHSPACEDRSRVELRLDRTTPAPPPPPTPPPPSFRPPSAPPARGCTADLCAIGPSRAHAPPAALVAAMVGALAIRARRRRTLRPRCR